MTVNQARVSHSYGEFSAGSHLLDRRNLARFVHYQG